MSADPSAEVSAGQRWLSALRELVGKPDEAVIRRALEATLSLLAEAVPAADQQDLAEELPAELGRCWLEPTSSPPVELGGAADLVVAVAARAQIPLNRAKELVEVIVGQLGVRLSQTMIWRLEQHLPASIVDLLVAAGAATPAAGERGAPAKARGIPAANLAEGRPGSRRPISEGRPLGAHQHSLVREDNPHGDSKLSSTRGLTQEREDETLATGRPGPSRL